jgi:hypothetical protein
LLAWPEGDPLLAQLAERLALLARSLGKSCAPGPGGYRLLRFRPRSQDPALALLELAALDPSLAALAGARLTDPALLSRSASERVRAALDLERAWLDSGLVLPLMTTQHWLATSEHLRGVRVSPLGMPSLLRAWTTGLVQRPQP